MSKISPKPKPQTDADRAYLAQIAERAAQAVTVVACRRHPERRCPGECRFILHNEECSWDRRPVPVTP